LSKRSATTSLLVLLLLCLPVVCLGDLCHDYGDQMRWLDYVETGMFTADVAIRDQLACLVGIESPLSVVDISNPAAVSVLGEVAVADVPNAVAMTATHAVVVGMAEWPATNGTLQLFDLTDPSSPSLAGELILTGGAHDVTVSGDYAFVVADGVQIIDISDPTNPGIVTSLSVPFARLLTLTGNILLVLGQETFPASLHVINVANPMLPEEIGYLELEKPANDLVAVDDFAYLSVEAETGGGLLVVNIADPKLPYPSLYFPVSDIEGRGLAVADGVAYLSARNIYAIDVEKPTAPKLLGSIKLNGFALRIQVHGNSAFLAMADLPGMHVLDVAEPRTTEPLISLPTDRNPGDMVLRGNHAFMVTHGSSFLCFDITDPLAPVTVSKIDLVDETAANQMVVDGDFAYITLEYPGSLEIVDITDPETPATVGSVALSDNNGGLTVVGDYAYVGAAGGLCIFDISDRHDPTFVTNLASAGSVSFATYGHYLLTMPYDSGSEQNWFRLFDITDPVAPVFAGQVAMPKVGSCQHVTVAGDLAYVCHYVYHHMRLFVVDLTDPTSPVILGETSYFSYLQDFVVAGDLAYGACLGGGLLVTDISDPTAPSFLGSMATADHDFCRAVALHPDYVLIASNGLLVAPLHCDTSIPVYLSRFDLQPSANAVDITWEILGATAAADFRLLSRRGAVIRKLPIVATNGTRYHARDEFDQFSPHTPITYSLSLRTGDGGWSLLHEQQIEPPTLPLLEPRLHGAMPNPFNPLTSISFSLDRPRQVQLTVHDVTGRLVTVLAREQFSAGRHELVWNGRDSAGREVASGEYFCRLQTEITSQVKKMLLLR